MPYFSYNSTYGKRLGAKAKKSNNKILRLLSPKGLLIINGINISHNRSHPNSIIRVMNLLKIINIF
jgi:hypothetical protein